MSKNQFSNGDILVCINDADQSVLKGGERYTVMGCHGGRVFINEYKRYGFLPERFKLVPQPRIEDFEVDNVVKCVNDLNTDGMLKFGEFYVVIHADLTTRTVKLEELPEVEFCMNRFFKVFEENPLKWLKKFE